MVHLFAIRRAKGLCTALLLCLPSLAAGCLGPPSLDEPDVASLQAAPEKNTARAAAVQDMRARAEAGEFLDYPDPFADPVMDAPEPLSVRDVTTTQSRLVATARSRNPAASAAKIAAGQARAAELRRLAQLRILEAEQRIRASGAQ